MAGGMLAQETFTGLVADSSTFASLPFVTVQVKNKNKGTSTDANGNFRISAMREDTLVFTSVGYKTVEYPLQDFEPEMILMAEQVTILDDVTILDHRNENPYDELFDERNEALRRANRKLPFFYSKVKRQKIKMGRLADENIRVQTYVDVIVKNEHLRNSLKEKYKLSDEEFYDLLGDFNAKNYTWMYYLSAPELLSLVNNFFEANASQR
jgi:hypothetical protein